MAQNVIELLFGVQGKGSVSTGSGALIVSDLTKIVNQINNGQTTVPKVKLKIDTSDVRKELQGLQNLAKSVVSGTASNGGSGKSASGNKKQEADQYRTLIANVKQYYTELAKLEKIQMKNSAVSVGDDGRWKTDDDTYTARVANINTLVDSMNQLKIVTTESDAVSIASAKELNITEEQRSRLLAQVRSAIIDNGIAHKDSERKVSDAWNKNAAKVHEYIARLREVASKNPEIARMMDELDRLATSDNPKNLDQLTNGFARLQQKVRETGADVETWGQKMSKTLGTRVRSLLAGILTAKVTQYIRQIYTNVVDLDKALVNLQIATGKTRSETKALISEYSQLAKQLGATTVEVAEAADTWLRQGYSTEETATLIKNSTMLAKLGQMESAEASKALTSAMKGYKVSVEDSLKIVDKFTAVDMEAAASAGDIATAMAETAASADVAGVSMDRLIGYIATVKEVTQDGAESVGTFYKTLFARMNNVAAGNFVDDETGESLNDVETVLNKLGISLRDANNEFRSSSDVLDDVASRWGSFDNVAQHAIATAFAGTRQQEKFIVLMENYGDAIRYAETASESAGTANEKYSAWLDGIQGKLNTLKSVFEDFSMTILQSELVTGSIDFLTWVVETLTNVIDAVGGLNGVLYVTASLVATIKAESIVSFVASIYTAIAKLISFIISLIASMKIAKTEGVTMGAFIKNAFYQITAGATSAQVAVGALAAILGIALVAISSYNSHIQTSINNSISAANAANAEGKEYISTAKSLEELADEYEALAKANNGVFSGESAEKVKSIQSKITDLVGDQADNIDLVNGKLDEEIKKMRELATGTGGAVSNAISQGKTQISEATNAYKEMVGSAFASTNLIGGESFWEILFGLFSFGGMTDFTKQWTEDFDVDIEQTRVPGSFGPYTTYGYGFKSEYDTIEEFIAQYERIAALYQALGADYGESELFKAASTYLTTYQDIYKTYQSGVGLIEEANAIKDEIEGSFEDGQANGIGATLKSAADILSEVQDGFDGLVDAMTNVTSEGYLTADALANLFKLQQDNKLAGLDLSKVLIQDANGYKLADNALQLYVQSLITAYSVQGAFKTPQDRQNAIGTLVNLQSVLATLIATQNNSTDASKARRQELEKEKEAYEDQLDKFEELIELRKELLQSYKEELDYQKELDKRQQNVSTLQTKLAIARLDQSAAGQARVRQLEADLKEAQDELDDFTLEHAIDVLTDELDDTSAEWKAMIKGKLDTIANLLEQMDNTPDVNVSVDTSWAQSMLAQITQLIASLKASRWTSYEDAAKAGFSNIATEREFGRTSDAGKYGSYQAYLDAMYKKYMGVAPTYHTGGFVGGTSYATSNEEFAKLLQGEFVATPTQMKRFMENTLPKAVGYAASSHSNEFNAPLIEIKCESVTTEALPSLERVVNEAVQEIKRELDSGMSRTGFKRPATRRLV